VGTQVQTKTFVHIVRAFLPQQRPPSTVAVPWLSATAAIVPITDSAPITSEMTICLHALAARVFAAPLSIFEPVEQCGRVVTVRVEPVKVMADPVLPFPLVALPTKFWNQYHGFVSLLDEFFRTADHRFMHTADKRRQLGKLTKRLWKQADVLVAMAAGQLRPHEATYFQARLLAALAGEMKGNEGKR